MYCKYCGKNNTDEAMYCISCGKPIVISKKHGKTNSATSNVKEKFIQYADNQSAKYKKRVNTHSMFRDLSIIAAVLFIAVFSIKLLNGIKLDSLTFWTYLGGYALVIIGLFYKKNPLPLIGFIMIAAGHAVVAYLYAQGDYGLKNFYYDEMFHNIVYCSSFILMALSITLTGKTSLLFAIPAILIRVLYRLIILMNGSPLSRGALVDIIEVLAFCIICVMNRKKHKGFRF